MSHDSIPFRYITRPYLHFDPVISEDAAQRLVTDPELVARHAFYPFIEYALVTHKIRAKPGGGVESCEPKVRKIAYAGHTGSHIFAYYSSVLVKSYEEELRPMP